MLIDLPEPEDSASVKARRQYGPGTRIRVMVPLPIGTTTGGIYDYWLPDQVRAGTMVDIGTYIEVPVGKRLLPAIVWETEPVPEPNPSGRTVTLKPVSRVFDLPPIPEISRKLIIWMAHYYAAAPGTVLKMFLNTPSALETPPEITAFRPVPRLPADLRLTPARKRVLAAFSDTPVMTGGELAKAAGCGTTVVTGLAEQGGLEKVVLPGLPPRAGRPDWALPGPTLSPDQAAAAEALIAAVDSGSNHVAVIDGVTGAGKTEVYQEAIAAALKRGQQVLVLLPEIALSAQWLDRFAARFGATPTIWNSELTPAARRDSRCRHRD